MKVKVAAKINLMLDNYKIEYTKLISGEESVNKILDDIREIFNA